MERIENYSLDKWPLYFKDALIVKNPKSNIAIATTWMPKENIADALDNVDFCVCGQLYTKRGINFMFRNIFANPIIRYIIVCGVDRQGSGAALLKFFENGFEELLGESGERKGWKIIGDDDALLDKEFTQEALLSVQHSIKIFDFILKPTTQIAVKINELNISSLDPFCEPQVFAEPEKTAVTRYPSDLSVFKIRREKIADAWIDALKTISKFGFTIPGMYGDVKEVHNLSIIIQDEDPQNPFLPDFLNFGQDSLTHYIEGFFDTDTKGQAYTYGERIFTWDNIDQYKAMSEKLKRYPYDRGSIAVLWKPHVDNFPPQNAEIKQNGQTKGWKVPCLVMLLAQCIDDKLNMTCVFRNNDIYGAWPLNAFALRSLQQRLARDIGKDMGTLTTISHIAEIYETDWQDSLRIVNENDNLARTCQYDPRGYYTVEIVDNHIVVKFFNPSGSEQLGEFIENGMKPKVARDLCALAIKEMFISDLGAAADLGRQLAKAETAVKLGLKFTQDQVLSFR